jgi:hypothetical protein
MNALKESKEIHTFQLATKARDFAKQLRKDFLKIELDTYYLCALLGLAFDEPEVEIGESNQILPSGAGYPAPYKNTYRLLNAILLSTYIKSNAIDLKDRKKVKEAIATIIDPEHPAHLTKKGIALMNQYSAGGAAIMLKHFPDEDITNPLYFADQLVKKIASAAT